MLTRFALANPMLVVALLLASLIAGPFSFLTHPSREDPKITIRNAAVIATFPGMAASKIESLITVTLEEKIREIPEVDEINSISSTGQALVNITVADQYTDMTKIWSDLRDKVEEAKPDLPEGTLGPFVNTDKGDVAMATIALTADGFTNAELHVAAKRMRRSLYASIPGIRKVTFYGVLEEQIFVEFDVVRLAQLGLDPQIIMSTIQGQNVIQPGGRVEVHGQTLTVQPTGDFADLTQMESLPIALPDNSGRVLYLRDLASIRYGYKDPPGPHAFFNDEPGIVIGISMVDGFDANAFSSALLTFTDIAKLELPLGMFLEYITFQQAEINTAIFNVLNNLWQTVLIVLAVVIAFLGFRTGLIVGAMVPLVMLVTILIMRWAGIDLESMSLASLIIALGLLVDNGIVVAEEFQGRLARGHNRWTIARELGPNLSMPLLAASLTTIFAFMPLMLMPGSAGEYTRSISLVLAIALLVSWVLALTVLILLCAWFMKPGPVIDEESAYSGRFYGLYRALITRLVRMRLLVVPLSFATIVIGVILFGSVAKIFFPASERTQLQVVVELPVGTNTYGTQTVVWRLSDWLGDKTINPEVKNSVSYVSNGGPRFYLSLSPIDGFPNNAYMIVNVNTPQEVGVLAARVRKFAAASVPEARVTPKKMSLGPGEAGLVEYRITGADTLTLKVISADIQTAMRAVAGTVDVKDDWENPSITVRVIIDQEAARRAGVTSSDIASALNAQLSGVEVTDYRIGERVIPVIMRAQGEARLNIDRMRTLNVGGSSGKPVPLLQIASFEGDPQYSRIKRRDLVRVVTVSGRHMSETAAGLDGLVAPALADIIKSLPHGYTIEAGGELEDSAEANSKLSANMPLAFALMVFVLIWQFNSFIKPALIISVIPLAITGVAAALLIAPGANFGFMAILGFLALAGIVINNAIILIDYIDIERTRCATVAEAVVEAGVRRLRPILMTTCTTALGLLPIIISRDVLFYDLALVIGGGLVFATMLTLIVIPCMYAIVFRTVGPEDGVEATEVASE
ncbi:MAG: efflux RND transporter permease subunit [Alphaproteobacteria bacterium]